MRILKLLNIMLALIICAGGTLAQSKRQMKEQNESLKLEVDFLRKLMAHKEHQEQLEKANYGWGENVESTQLEKIYFDNRNNHPEKLQAIGDASDSSFQVAYDEAVKVARQEINDKLSTFSMLVYYISEKIKQTNGNNENKDLFPYYDYLDYESFFDKLKHKVVDYNKTYNDTTGVYTVQVLMEIDSNLELNQDDNQEKRSNVNSNDLCQSDDDELEDIELEDVDSICQKCMDKPEMLEDLSLSIEQKLRSFIQQKLPIVREQLISIDEETKELTKKQLREQNNLLKREIVYLRVLSRIITHEREMWDYLRKTRLDYSYDEKMNANPGQFLFLGLGTGQSIQYALYKAEEDIRNESYNYITDFARASYALHAMIMQKKGEKEDKELLNGFFSHFRKNLMNGYKIVDYEKFFNRAKGEYKVQILVDYDIPVETNTKEFKAIRDIATYIQSFFILKNR